MPSFIELENVSFEYKINGLESLVAVDNVTLSIGRGSHVAILGRNGSGKSTLARLINGLELPASGSVTVDGLVHDGGRNSIEIRRKCGIVFQNPDNQIIGTTVEEDVAFGPENLGMPREAMIEAIDRALAAVGLSEKRRTAPHLLSGGQKQKLAIAGILAMDPECFILDEATSMLDPSARRDFMDLITGLVRERGLTIINITHDMEEAILADYVYVMSDGRIVGEGAPSDLFEEATFLRSQGLDVPVHIEIAQIISRLTGVERIRGAAFTPQGAREEIRRMCDDYTGNGHALAAGTDAGSGEASGGEPVGIPESGCRQEDRSDGDVLSVDSLSYTYARETVFSNDALKDITFSIRQGELFGIVGHTGSGKSTLVQHFNGLLRPQKGKVVVMGFDTSRKEGIKEIRKRAGLLFQYPEHQLFEETVFRDVAFGPKCLGMSAEETREAVENALDIVGLGEDFRSKSPFELSGGQKRRVAIAGILAMKPDILILDEPAAGLDPEGREEILTFVKDLSASGKTVILVSHNMDDIARMADRVLVLQEGKMRTCASPRTLFAGSGDVEGFGISYPVISVFMREMKKIYPGLQQMHFTAEGCSRDILEAALGAGGGVAG